MKLSKDSPIIKHNVNQWEWKSAKENATKVAICVACRKGSDDAFYYDIIAELEYEEFLKIKNELRPTFGHNNVWTIGGLELGFLYPLHVYSEKRTVTESSGLFYLQTKIVMQNESSHLPCLFDTGAGMCHMTFPFWVKLKQHVRFFDENKRLCELVKIISADELTFDNIPIYKKRGTTIGDGSSILVFPVKIDSISFVLNKLGSGVPVTLNNITVNVMDHLESHFITGCNVIKYLKLHSEPIGDEFTISVDFTEDGRRLLEKDRIDKKNNYMTHFYNHEDLMQL